MQINGDYGMINSLKRIQELWLAILSHRMEEEASLAPGSIYLIPFNLYVSYQRIRAIYQRHQKSPQREASNARKKLLCQIIAFHISYRNLRKSSKSEIINRSKFSIVPNRESIIEHISSLQ